MGAKHVGVRLRVGLVKPAMQGGTGRGASPESGDKDPLRVAGTFAALLILGLATGTATQAQTISESVKRVKPGESLNVMQWGERTRVVFEKMAHDATVVVEAQLANPVVVESADGTELHTDYEQKAITTVAGEMAHREPGRPLVRQWGGDTVVDGVSVHFHEGGFPRLPTGQRVLLFLVYRPDTSRYVVSGDGAGAFIVDGGGFLTRFQNPSILVSARTGRIQLADMVADIRRLGR